MFSALFLRRLFGSDHPTPASKWGLTPTLWPAFIVLCFALTADVVTTGLFLTTGNGVEGNPVAALILHGSILSLAGFKLFSLLVVYGLCRLLVIDGNPRYLFVLRLGLYSITAIFVVVSFSNLMATFIGEDLFHFLVNVIQYR